MFLRMDFLKSFTILTRCPIAFPVGKDELSRLASFKDHTREKIKRRSRRNLKNDVFTPKTQQMFSVYTTAEESKKATITSRVFGFVFEENWGSVFHPH